MRGLEHIPWLYDLGMALPDRGRLGRWRAWLTGGVRGRVLEVGCGTGLNLPLYSRGTRVVALEPDASNLSAARRRAGGIPLVQARAEALPFREGAFDTVTSSLVLCSVDEPVQALAELRRVLAARGEIRMIEHVRARSSWAARLQDASQPAWTWLTGGCRPNRETERLVEAAGFRIARDTRRARGVMRRFVASM